MGRPARFDAEQILDAAAYIVAESGPAEATIVAIGQRLGAPSGSIYHRFESRDLLLARLWIRSVRRAQEGFISALALEDLDHAAVSAALHIPRWSRKNLSEATVLLLYRREDLAERWPAQLGREVARLNSGVEAAMRVFTRQVFGRVSSTNLQKVAFALVDVPYGACRRYLVAGKPPPPAVDDLVARVCRCVLFD
jgi:AcrR family transcriptional regulator